jgi:hypothetical protein
MTAHFDISRPCVVRVDEAATRAAISGRINRPRPENNQDLRTRSLSSVVHTPSPRGEGLFPSGEFLRPADELGVFPILERFNREFAVTTADDPERFATDRTLAADARSVVAAHVAG